MIERYPAPVIVISASGGMQMVNGLIKHTYGLTVSGTQDNGTGPVYPGLNVVDKDAHPIAFVGGFGVAYQRK